MLRFASREAVTRGLDFQLGIWTHAHEWIDSPDARYTIDGLTPDRHAAYCRDALQAVLEACPDIGGLTIRTHGESGIPERSWDFWRTVLDGVAGCGRRVGLDLHPKGLDAETLEIALATGMPITLSPSTPRAHGAALPPDGDPRARPPADRSGPRDDGKAAYMNVCEGTRPFTRYSYGDFLREDRPYDVVFRIWPGTQRVLLWGDPAMASGFGRLASIAGTQGLEWADPLSLRGREGTALPGPRNGYADLTLSPADDWEKYAYTYRLFGHLAYDPDAQPETWRRHLRTAYGPVAAPAEAALASASRILPLVTTAHHPSASNNYYWPEIYTDIGIVGEDGSVETHYYDTPTPKRFGTVGPLDPEVFAGAEESVREALEGPPSGRYSPLDVAGWLERLSDEAVGHLGRVEAEARNLRSRDPAPDRGRRDPGRPRPVLRGEDARSGPVRALHEDARSGGAAGRADGASDGSVGVDDRGGSRVRRLRGRPHLRPAGVAPGNVVRPSPGDRRGPRRDDRTGSLGRVRCRDDRSRDRSSGAQTHTRIAGRRHLASAAAAVRSRRGITIALDLPDAAGEEIAGVSLRYRHLDQSELYEHVEMERDEGRYVATIDGRYSDAPYALQYLFVVRDPDGGAWLYPGLAADLSNQPYYLIRQEPEPTPAST